MGYDNGSFQKVGVSPVVHVRNLTENATDTDIHEAVINFGTIGYSRLPHLSCSLYLGLVNCPVVVF